MNILLISKMRIKKDKYQIRFFPVGTASKGGDAILIRVYDEYDNERLILIDGGYGDTGDDIITCIKNECQTQTIDVMINTHPDQDHTSGLIKVLECEDIKVTGIIMNRPWQDAGFTKEMFDDKRITDNSLLKRLKDNFTFADQLEKTANIRGIGIYDASTGNSLYDGALIILGPSVGFYQKELLASDKTPQSYISSRIEKTYSHKPYTEEYCQKGQFIQWFDDEETSEVNQTSLIIALNLGVTKALFTGDAGKIALERALDFYDTHCGSSKDFTIVQLPHHGSRKNISPAIINRFGNPDYIISCPPEGEGEGHPSRRLINKILEINRTARIFRTENVSFTFYNGVSVRYNPQTPAGWNDKIDGR